MPKPGIKGSVFAGIVEQVRGLRDTGRVSREELEQRLGAEGLACLEEKIQAAKWYPIELYGAIRELLRDVEGGGRDEYTIQSGAESARRLIESGLYQQLDFLKRWGDHVPGDAATEEARRANFRRQLVLVSSIHNSLFTGTGDAKISALPDAPDRFEIVYRDGGVIPEVCRLAFLGFWNELSRHWSAQGRGDLWSKTDADDHFLLRMTRDLADV